MLGANGMLAKRISAPASGAATRAGTFSLIVQRRRREVAQRIQSIGADSYKKSSTAPRQGSFAPGDRQRGIVFGLYLGVELILIDRTARHLASTPRPLAREVAGQR